MIENMLKNAIEEKTLIGLRTVSQTLDESIIGFVTKLEDSFFTINELDENGFLIGNTQISIEDVINIDINDRYQKRLMFLYKNNSVFNANEAVTIWKEAEALLPYLKAVKVDKKLTTLYFDEDNYVICFILDYDDHYVMLKNIGREGDEDGNSYYPIDRLIGLRYNGIQEQKIKLLYENRVNFY